jgi:putative ABC transport system permease protein
MKMMVRLIGESFLVAWQALVNNKLRTTLSLLGVTIGIFSIIFVLSIVDSMEADMKESLNMIGSDLLFVQKWPMGPEDGAEEYEWWKYMKRRPPSVKDSETLQKRLDGASAIAFKSGKSVTVEFENNFLKDAYLMGISYEYNTAMPIKLVAGRYFSELECEGGNNYAIVGHEVALALFPQGNALGKEIKVNGQKLNIIGLMQKEGASLFGTGMDKSIFTPINYSVRLLDPESEDNSIIVKAEGGITNAELKDEVTAVFREIRSVKPDDANDFSIIESSMISSIVDNVVGVFNTAGMFIGIFAILIGAFSIANIMFVSVKERTNLIGIQKSLGAKNSFILTQFLFEAVALCILGGLFGIGFVWLSVKGLSSAFDMNFILPVSRIFMGMGISVAVGVVAGILPAWQAAKLSPVDAMRSK